MPAISSMAESKAASLAFDGLLKPVIFLTNWSEAARISSSVTAGSKLKRVLIFRHIEQALEDQDFPAGEKAVRIPPILKQSGECPPLARFSGGAAIAAISGAT
jgi:hypothetical protein